MGGLILMSKIDIIKYEGDNSTFVWKHPVEDFYTGTQLLVHESQEAIFFMNGQALDLFGAGRHTLESQNLPMLSRLFNKPFGNETPFHCEVYFINKTEQMAIKWGTDSKVEYVEPTYKFPLQIGASGEMTLRAEDARKLLVKVVGTTAGVTQQMLVQKFRGILMMRVKTYLANLIREQSINIFSIDEHLTAVSDALHMRLIPDFADYGLALEKFYVTTIVKPEEDRNYQRFKELHFRQYADVAEAQLRQQIGLIDQQTQAQRMVIEAQGIAQKRALEGYTYQDERSFDVAERVASNDAIAQMSNLGIGLGTMAGIGGTVSGLMTNALGNAVNHQAPAAWQQAQIECPYCQTKLPADAKFCFGCGQKVEMLAANEMICPSCGKKTPAGKFCMECGHPLANTCPNCGNELPAGAKFCLNCGQKL